MMGLLVMASCRHQGNEYALNHQDRDAKQMLQGVWIDDEEGAPVFLAKGDSLLFPDTTSLPMHFWIYQDSLYVEGSSIDRYLITKQAEHVLRFVNQSGDEVKLVKASDNHMLPLFRQERPYALNIFRTLSVDTTAVVGNRHYDCSIRVEPTSNRILTSSFTDQGLRVDNMYLDNDAHVRLSCNQTLFYEHHFRKQEFSAYVPKEFLNKAILSSVQFDHADTAAVYLDAVIGVPDATSAFVVMMKVGRNGKLTKTLK